VEPSKAKKLLGYAKLLAKEGESAEKNGLEEEAIPKYIKVVDILLLLAESTENYEAWTDYTGKADFYQKRTKILIAKVSMKRDKEENKAASVSKPDSQSQVVRVPG
jgi:hypothetical protein